jgi:hypothetical protein
VITDAIRTKGLGASPTFSRSDATFAGCQAPDRQGQLLGAQVQIDRAKFYGAAVTVFLPRLNSE